jgi:hypothetical protein
LESGRFAPVSIDWDLDEDKPDPELFVLIPGVAQVVESEQFCDHGESGHTRVTNAIQEGWGGGLLPEFTCEHCGVNVRSLNGHRPPDILAHYHRGNDNPIRSNHSSYWRMQR